jgi:hypothetical protein
MRQNRRRLPPKVASSRNLAFTAFYAGDTPAHSPLVGRHAGSNNPELDAANCNSAHANCTQYNPVQVSTSKYHQLKFLIVFDEKTPASPIWHQPATTP